MDHAHRLAQEHLIIDGHIDVPYRLSTYMEDISQETVGGDFDYPKAVAGGLNAPFMSIYVPSVRQDIPGSAKSLADSLIDMVEGFVTHAIAVGTRVSPGPPHRSGRAR